MRENAPQLGDLAVDFDFGVAPRKPLFLPVHPGTDLIAPPASGSGATGAVHSAAAACFKAAGATVTGPNPAGQGIAVYAITRDSGEIGLLEGPSAAVAARIADVFSGAGWKLKPLKNNPRGVGIYKGTLTSADSALLSKCGG